MVLQLMFYLYLAILLSKSERCHLAPGAESKMESRNWSKVSNQSFSYNQAKSTKAFFYSKS